MARRQTCRAQFVATPTRMGDRTSEVLFLPFGIDHGKACPMRRHGADETSGQRAVRTGQARSTNALFQGSPNQALHYRAAPFGSKGRDGACFAFYVAGDLSGQRL